MWLHFTTGRGPNECHVFCQRAVGKFIDEATAAKLTVTLLEVHETDCGWSSALLAVEGDADALVKSWEGTVQWSCPSSLRPGWGRKNWFIAVNAIRPPEASQILRESDVQFQAFRSSGPGGQHVQKTDSAVRVTHLPTKLTAQAQEERSQHRNKALAMARLVALLAATASDNAKAVERNIWSKHDQLERGNPVRVYKGQEFKRHLP